ncbi:HTH-type transcriptional activator RhaS [Arenibacter antarcticus]|uniref:Helix-turn-helix domain-containing protein n=1 Tax=Arenibacter antarcticus TaxID=2040469 RepID=A0ABW5VFR7_9FLAO|nr:helix-turn-helix domain-containing protein [Arenibacter sp. H213]MCM4167370.1 hypothetical protein [Arenibacter sp. H213]
MDQFEDKERLTRIFQVLIGIAMGKFYHRIERTNKKDELEALSALVNIVAEELQDSFLHQGYINLNDSYMQLVHMVFFLDKQSYIVYINEDVQLLLNFEREDLLNTPFVKILHKDSIKTWKDHKKNRSSNGALERNLRLNFMTKDGLELAEFCKVILVPKGAHPKARLMLITSDIVKNKTKLEGKFQQQLLRDIHHPKPGSGNSNYKRNFLSIADIENIRAIGTYLRHHFEKEALSLKDLALNFGTNEFKLKRGFKELFGMTVFKFLKNERLKNAYISVRNTQESFKLIAQQNGFRNASHFSREFKARYGYTPSELRKNS